MNTGFINTPSGSRAARRHRTEVTAQRLGPDQSKDDNIKEEDVERKSSSGHIFI